MATSSKRRAEKLPVHKLSPNLPQHNLPEPYASLQTAGWDEVLDLYLKFAELAGTDEVHRVVEQLTAMALDETYYEYGDPVEENTRDPRTYAPLQAVRALCYVPEDAARVMSLLIPLFDSEDDSLREELPFLFAAMGQEAKDELIQVTLDQNANIAFRDGAAESLVEMVDDYPEFYAEVHGVLEKALKGCKHPELSGYLVLDLMDLGAIELMGAIEEAYAEKRVDEEIVTLEQAQQHFAEVAADADGDEHVDDESDFEDYDDEEDVEVDDAPQEPFIAPEKVGRNEPCPCGSGKKYKRCCGAL